MPFTDDNTEQIFNFVTSFLVLTPIVVGIQNTDGARSEWGNGFAVTSTTKVNFTLLKMFSEAVSWMYIAIGF